MSRGQFKIFQATLMRLLQAILKPLLNWGFSVQMVTSGQALRPNATAIIATSCTVQVSYRIEESDTFERLVELQAAGCMSDYKAHVTNALPDNIQA
jgi:hypothetical protein